MAFAYVLTPEIRIKLKKPLGTLIKGAYDETVEQLKSMIAYEKPSAIISVGDAVSRNLVENGVLPKLVIVDNKVMRKEIAPVTVQAEKTIAAKNPAGTITEEAVAAVKEAIECDFKVKILVEGEEDLLALIAVLYAPENSFVVYGQPYQGVVVIKVTEDKRREISEILKVMEKVRKAK